MRRLWYAFVFGTVAAGAVALAQQSGRIPSPRGTASTELGGKYVPGKPAARYEGGKWIEITYGRPIRRERDLWGSGQDYGKALLAGAPIWRAGADVSTRLKTEVPLVINGKTVAPGEYSLFVDLKPNNWTLVVSTWAAAEKYDPSNKTALWGAYGYTPDKDVVRAPMKLDTLPMSFDQLTWQFADVSAAGGSLVLTWDKMMASVPFKVGS
jgi:hypothetical protein